MSEIVKCPICGNEPYLSIHTSSMGCCGMYYQAVKRTDIEQGWNKIAAAMELAKLTVEMKTCRAYCPERAFLYAQDHVLEIFNGHNL